MFKVPLTILLLAVIFPLAASPFVHSRSAKLTASSRVTFQGIDPIRVPMSQVAAERAIMGKLVRVQPEEEGCTFVKPKNGPTGIFFMVIKGRIVRIDVENRFTQTDRGARVGDSEAKIKRLYPGVRASPHAYVEGHYLTVISPDGHYGIVFETDGTKVTQYRAGTLQSVGYVEGCS